MNANRRLLEQEEPDDELGNFLNEEEEVETQIDIVGNDVYAAGPCPSNRIDMQRQSPEVLQQENEESGWVEEIVEEELHGTVMLGHDGQYYISVTNVLTEDLRSIDLEQVHNVMVVDNEDESQTLVLEDSSQRDKLIASKARAKVEAVMQKRSETDTEGQEIDQSAEYPLPPASHEVVQEEVLDYDGRAEVDVDEFGIQQRRSRVFGRCRCEECGQTFVNTARLERHLAVHQQYGAYLCPLCGKTYKYEYNLFYHWRRTCRDMNELLSPDERKVIEINALRQLVEEIAQKKATIGPLELDNRKPHNRANQNQTFDFKYQQHKMIEQQQLAGLDQKLSATSLFGDKILYCPLCELGVYQHHLSAHLEVHRDERELDAPSVGGAFFCDLCGLMFRFHDNLIRHWRNACVEIQANLPLNCDVAMDNEGLKQLVLDLLRKASREDSESAVFEQQMVAAFEEEQQQPGPSHQKARRMSKQRQMHDFTRQIVRVEDHLTEFGEEWAQNEGVIFADDFLETGEEGEEEDMLLINEEGKLIRPLEYQQQQQLGHVNRYVPNQSAAARAVRGPDGELRWIQYPQSVQCNECYRSFSSIQRLEKHMAGAHCSFGTHHCLLCGCRFKFEYSLLFHYRQVCPYALELLDKELRQQMEASDLKKTVRQLAARPDLQARIQSIKMAASSSAMQQSAHLDGRTESPDGTHEPVKPELGDSIIRRQMMKKIIQEHAGKRRQKQFLPNQPYLHLPQQLLQPTNRPDLPQGTECPICSVVFYGLKVLARHLRAAHPNESAVWEESLRALGADADVKAPVCAPKLRPRHLGLPRKRRPVPDAKLREESEERPPKLEMEEQQQQSTSSQPRGRHTIRQMEEAEHYGPQQHRYGSTRRKRQQHHEEDF